MKRWILLFLLLVVPGVTFAQMGVMGLTYRGGDPFVFCRYGLDRTPKAWIPVPTYTGQFIITPGYCPGPTPNCGPYLIGWSFDEIQSYYQYLRICPVAIKSGSWDGQKGGDGTTTPFKH